MLRLIIYAVLIEVERPSWQSQPRNLWSVTVLFVAQEITVINWTWHNPPGFEDDERRSLAKRWDQQETD